MFFVLQVSDAHEVELHLALLRLPTHDTDVLITLNDPVGLRCALQQLLTLTGYPGTQKRSVWAVSDASTSPHRRTSSPVPAVGTAHREETEWVFANTFETLKLIDASILM